MIHGNALEHVTDAYKRYLEGRFRDALQAGRHAAADRDASSRNPFDDKALSLTRA